MEKQDNPAPREQVAMVLLKAPTHRWDQCLQLADTVIRTIDHAREHDVRAAVQHLIESTGRVHRMANRGDEPAVDEAIAQFDAAKSQLFSLLGIEDQA